MPDAALAATADALVRRALAALPPDRPHGRADLARLPEPVGHLLGARLDAAVDAVAPASPYVDAGAAAEATAAWRQAVRPAAQFPADGWEEAVRSATRDALAHLVRPATTLAAAATADADGPVPVATALARMRAFGPYPYFPEIVGRYAERKGGEALDRGGLERLLGRIHQRMVEQFGPDEWALFLEPLFALAGPVGRPVGTVPAALFRPLFPPDGPDLGRAPYRLAGLRERLAGPAPADVPFRFDVPAPEAPTPDTSEAGPPAPEAPAPRQIATGPPELHPPPMPPVAEGVRPPVIGSRVGSPEEALDDDSAVLGPPRPVAPDGPPPAPAADDEEPLWKRLARERGDAPTPVTQAAADDEEPLWKRLAREQGDAPPPASMPPADAPSAQAPLPEAPDDPDAVEARVLGRGARENRDWYLADLFGGDAEAYHATLARLDAAPTYTAATAVISDDVFRAHRVNPYTEAAVAFTDAVQAQFGGR